MVLSMIPRVEEESDDFGLIERRARLSRLGCWGASRPSWMVGAVDDDAGGFVVGEQVDGDVFGGQGARGLGAFTGRCAAIGGQGGRVTFWHRPCCWCWVSRPARRMLGIFGSSADTAGSIGTGSGLIGTGSIRFR